MKVVVALFGLVVSALAQETSSYTGPMFDPDTAPFFGPSTIVFPSVTESAPCYGQLDAVDFNVVAQLYDLAFLNAFLHAFLSTLLYVG
ncbi:uncharacterized protein ALTATR162_LOCUS9440 [Alternaria atra]|uniref:Uncharacterized protein n=1 Tax=Alternaria atra TaxID=119953 RepID=A0A8J2I8I6_9PLEO|nr:uncharacterized protein ALTATR162_LOCUS9440 [Alternaria atra]CAG5180814.1 unnamed protein product [Alternaria atra]